MFLALALCSLSAQEKRHDKFAREAGCITCHTKIPDKNSSAPIILKDDSGKWCLTCHDMEESTLHPTGIISQNTSLPHESNNRMSCLTCHSPHGNEIASQPWISTSLSDTGRTSFKTYLLNKPNTHGELCKQCHKNG